MSRSRYPNPPYAFTQQALDEAWNALTRELDTRDSRFYSPGATKWIVTNTSTVTSINTSTAADPYTANVLGSLITALKNKGII